MAHTLRQSSTRSHAIAVSVGKRLREARLQQGLTQVDLEKATGLLRSHISRIETGRRLPSLETLSRLAGALNLPLTALFQEDSYSPPYPATQVDESGTEGAALAHEGDAFMEDLKAALSRLNEADQRVILATARKMARRASITRWDQEEDD